MTNLKPFRRIFDGITSFSSNFDGSFTEETNSVHLFLSVLPFSWLLAHLRAYEVVALPSYWQEAHL